MNNSQTSSYKMFMYSVFGSTVDWKTFSSTAI